MTTNKRKQIEERLLQGPATLATIARELGCGTNSLTASLQKLRYEFRAVYIGHTTTDPITGRKASVWYHQDYSYPLTQAHGRHSQKAAELFAEEFGLLTHDLNSNEHLKFEALIEERFKALKQA